MLLPQIDAVSEAVLRLADRLHTVEVESLPLSQLAGRVLAEPLLADRDNPPLDVSAMDGYAIRLADAECGSLPIIARATAGSPPVELQPQGAVQIFTGAPIPIGADCVIPREQTREAPDRVELDPVGELKAGQHIRYRGENARVGSQVLAAGTLLNSTAVAAVASVAGPQLSVHRKIKVAIVNTGDELVSPGQPASDWQIRDSNGPTLAAALARAEWMKLCARVRAADQLSTISETLSNLLPAADAIVVTGGVSVGDTDHVPAAIEKLGGEIVFHRLPIRPGKPVLGAIMPEGKLIIGLPGNPVSVAVTSVVVALPLLRKLGGLAPLMTGHPRVLIANPDDKQLKLQWYRLVEVTADGEVRYVDSRGSGDLISLAHSAGFVTIPPGMSGSGPWPLTLWS
jgi:molybdopterin molybdotransferase